VISVNNIQRQMIVDKIKKHFNNNLEGKRFALWGLAFKPDTDDIREAPSLYVIDQLIKAGAQVTAFDPEAMNNVRKNIGDKIQYGTDEYDVLKNADALIIATEWALFRTPDFEKMMGLMKNKIIFDGRNLYDLARMKELGFTYHSIGREIVQ
jgi:UDPglucose 6-dehydrogenase